MPKYGMVSEQELIEEAKKNNETRKAILKELAEYGVPKEVIYHDMKGKEKDELYSNSSWIEDGAVLDIYSKKGAFIRRYSEHSKLAPYLVDDVPADTVDLENATPEDLKKSFKKLLKEVEKTTHWYMKSSPEFKDFRQSLKDLINGDLSNENFRYRKVDEVARKADLYLAAKEDPDVEITSNTIPRLQVAHQVSMMLKGSLAPVIENGYKIDVNLEDEFEIIDKDAIKDEIPDVGVSIDEEFVKQVENDVEPEGPTVNQDKVLEIDGDEILVENDPEDFISK